MAAYDVDVNDDNVIVYTVEVDTKKTTILKVTDDMIQQEILEDIEEARKKLIEYHNDPIKTTQFDYTQFSLQSFNDYENTIPMESSNPEEKKEFVVKYIMAPEYCIFHIFGFLQSIFGKEIAIQIYLKLKYGYNMKQIISFHTRDTPTISYLVISGYHEHDMFKNLFFNLGKILDWDYNEMKWPVLQHLDEKEKREICDKYITFRNILPSHKSWSGVVELFEEHPEYVYYRQIQEVECKMKTYFKSLGSLMEKFPDDYIRIVERIKKQHDQKMCDLRDKYSPLSKMGPASSSSKRQRED